MRIQLKIIIMFSKKPMGKDSRSTNCTRMRALSHLEAPIFERCKEGTKTMLGTMN